MVQSGLLAQLVANSTATQQRLDRLTLQSSSGAVATTYGGLGTAASVSLDLRPQMAEVTAWQQNVTMASTSLTTTQGVLQQLQGIASSFSADAIGTEMQTSSGAAVLAGQAQLALQQVVGLLNTAQGGSYAFAGAASQAAPVDTGALAGFTASVQSAVGALGAGGNGTAVASAVIADGSTAAFTWPASGGTPAAASVPIGTNQSVPVAFVAGRNTFAPATSGGTGSYVRDLITGLAALAGLANTTASGTTLQSFGASISRLLGGAASAIGTEQAGFGAVQDQVSSQGTTLADTLTSLTTQVSSVEDVDMTATATALSQVQTQLQASYKLIAELPNLSLVAYL
jgi:flagellin-like hook-associated protein FlgL